MFCFKCGNQLPDDAKFCNKCGTAVNITVEENKSAAEDIKVEAVTEETVAEETVTEPIIESVSEKVSSEQKVETETNTQTNEIPTSQNKGPSLPPIKINKKLMVVVVAVIVVIALFAVLIKGCSSNKKIDLTDYIIIEFEGINGSGKISGDYDIDRFFEENEDKLILVDENENKEDARFATGLLLMAALEEGDIDPYENLSNGDVLKLTWPETNEALDELNKGYKCTFTMSEKEYKVEGLVDVVTEDAFSDLSVIFDGINGKGQASISSGTNGYKYEVVPDSGLSNGDTVTVKVKGVDGYKSLEEYAEAEGKVPAEMEKTFTVEGLLGYLTTLDGIDESAFDSIKINTDNYLQEKTSSEKQAFSLGTYRYNMDEREYAGRYLLVAKNPENDIHNKLLMIYRKHFNIHTLPQAEVTDLYVKILKDVDTDFDIYIGVLYDNVVLEDGTVCTAENSKAQVVSHKYEHIVEEDTYKSFAGTTDLKVLVEGYDSIEDMVAMLKDDYTVDYTFEENGEDITVSDGGNQASGKYAEIMSKLDDVWGRNWLEWTVDDFAKEKGLDLQNGVWSTGEVGHIFSACRYTDNSISMTEEVKVKKDYYISTNEYKNLYYMDNEAFYQEDLYLGEDAIIEGGIAEIARKNNIETLKDLIEYLNLDESSISDNIDKPDIIETELGKAEVCSYVDDVTGWDILSIDFVDMPDNIHLEFFDNEILSVKIECRRNDNAVENVDYSDLVGHYEESLQIVKNEADVFVNKKGELCVNFHGSLGLDDKDHVLTLGEIQTSSGSVLYCEIEIPYEIPYKLKLGLYFNEDGLNVLDGTWDDSTSVDIFEKM